MSLSGQTAVLELGQVPLYDLAPSPSRVDEIDSVLRVRLAEFLEYLAGSLPLEQGGSRGFLPRGQAQGRPGLSLGVLPLF